MAPAFGEALPDNVPRYGGGTELMAGLMMKAEVKDTFAHLEYGTMLVKAKYDTSMDFNVVKGAH